MIGKILSCIYQIFSSEIFVIYIYIYKQILRGPLPPLIVLALLSRLFTPRSVLAYVLRALLPVQTYKVKLCLPGNLSHRQSDKAPPLLG